MTVRAHGSFLVGLFGAAAVLGCRAPERVSPEPAPASTGSDVASTMAQATIEVKGMSCASCEVTVKKVAEKVPGVRAARASHAEERAWVTYDPSRTSPAAIAAAITDAGYEARPLAEAPAGSPP